MEGNGEFCTTVPVQEFQATKLELQQHTELGFVNLVASLEDGTKACIMCFWDGGYALKPINRELAERMAISITTIGHINQGDSSDIPRS